MATTKMTANKGASETRRAILRKMNELESEKDLATWARWQDLRDYIKGMAKRASKKPGGLGRR